MNIEKYLYNKNSIRVGFVLMMILWFVIGSRIADGQFVRVIFLLIDFLVLSTVIADEVMYQYYLRLELSLRKLVDVEGLILPRTFKSERLQLREMNLSDFKLIRLLSKDITVTEYVKDIDPNLSLKESRKWILSHLNLERTGLRCTRIIELKETGLPIGAVVIINGHELEYWILKNHREQGYALEAIEASLEIIEKEENIVLFAKCSDSNKRSCNLLKKLKFKVDETDDSGILHWVYSNRNSL